MTGPLRTSNQLRCRQDGHHSHPMPKCVPEDQLDIPGSDMVHIEIVRLTEMLDFSSGFVLFEGSVPAPRESRHSGMTA